MIPRLMSTVYDFMNHIHLIECFKDASTPVSNALIAQIESNSSKKHVFVSYYAHVSFIIAFHVAVCVALLSNYQYAYYYCILLPKIIS